VRGHLTCERITTVTNQKILSVDKDVDKLEPTNTDNKNARWIQTLEQTAWRGLKELKIEQPRDSAIPQMYIQKN
jgi:hypothetical protein